ncbi:MAG: trigger factor [Candidatus Dojkabacteria bacterium]|nr:trigger factor [Candidatus Dojkabacteria bacterium]
MSQSQKYKIDQVYNEQTYLEEITLTIPKSEFDEYFKKALKVAKKDFAAKGFRKGQAPDNAVLANKQNEIFEMAITNAANNALKDVKLDPLPLNQLAIKEVNLDSEGNILVKMEYIPRPYVEISVFENFQFEKVEPQSVTEDEIVNTIKNIWYSVVSKNKKNITKDDFSEHLLDEEFFKHEEFKKLYPDVNNLEELKNKITEEIRKSYEKLARIETAKRVKERIIELANYTKVEGLINLELRSRIENYLARYKSAGIDPEKYFEQNGITIEQLRDEWRPNVEKDVKYELFLQAYAEKNNISPTDEDLMEDVKKYSQELVNYYGNLNTAISVLKYTKINQMAEKDIFAKLGIEI